MRGDLLGDVSVEFSVYVDRSARITRQPRSSDMTARVGDVLPDIALTDENGAVWQLSDHRGRPVVLILHRHLA
jgi:hypothetical protein